MYHCEYPPSHLTFPKVFKTVLHGFGTQTQKVKSKHMSNRFGNNCMMDLDQKVSLHSVVGLE